MFEGWSDVSLAALEEGCPVCFPEVDPGQSLLDPSKYELDPPQPTCDACGGPRGPLSITAHATTPAFADFPSHRVHLVLCADCADEISNQLA